MTRLGLDKTKLSFCTIGRGHDIILRIQSVTPFFLCTAQTCSVVESALYLNSRQLLVCILRANNIHKGKQHDTRLICLL